MIVVTKTFKIKYHLQSCIQYKLKNRAESICWDLHNNFTFFVGGENGEISHFDMRNSEPVFSWKAHEEAICELSSIFGIKNCLVTCSEDNSIKAWNISQQPTNYIYKKKLKV
uniref:Periodic tryptophan protein 1 homolog (Trinotate prediction) n=1 Tax=Henneguya salminicola TaxID=69463 RepID=A0A6G3MEH3_HENSL